MSGFNPDRLTLARQRRGMNKSDLAEAADVAIRGISAYEAGTTDPTPETVDRLARALAVPAAFFRRAKVKRPSADSVSFRAMTSLTAAQRDAAIGAGAFAIELSDYLSAKLELPKAQIPDIRDVEPEVAAAAVREQWGLGVRPVRNMVHLLEYHGVRVFSLVERSVELDAYSHWHGDQAFCFLNTMKSVERSRLDAAHELGHLVMHKAGSKSRPDSEHEANRFAAAFLMPRSTVVESVPRGVTLSRLVKLKRRWGVSVAALVTHIGRLSIISPYQHRSMQIEMSTLGYRTSEPDPIETRETSQVLSKAFALLRKQGITKHDIARELCLYTHDLDAIVFGLTITGLTGGGDAGGAGKASPQLKLIS